MVSVRGTEISENLASPEGTIWFKVNNKYISNGEKWMSVRCSKGKIRFRRTMNRERLIKAAIEAYKKSLMKS